jgi:tripartite-type tricarboxylate transporter receptor subunit TctC
MPLDPLGIQKSYKYLEEDVTMNHRRTLVLALALLIAAAVPLQLRAKSYPSKPIRIYIGSAPGGALDTVTRLVTSKVNERNPAYVFVIDNRPGGSGLLVIPKAQEATADGYTLYSGSSNIILNQIFGKINRDIRETLAQTGILSLQANGLFVSNTVPVNNVKELLAYARTHPGKLNYYSPGVGSNYHLGVVRLESLTATKFTRIIYKGGSQAAIDLASGQIQMMFGSTSGLQVVRQGKAKMIAVATVNRLPDFPDVPTMIEAGVPDFDLASTYALYAPSHTPAAVMDALNREIAQAASAPDVVKKLAAGLGVAPPYSSVADKRKAFLAEYERWHEVVKKANIKLEE